MPTPAHTAEKTCFQVAAPWAPELDVRSDVAIIYGMNDSFASRLAGWHDRGYVTHFMTGIAWGGYQDYFSGKFDGATHNEDGQVERNGEIVPRSQHGAAVLAAGDQLEIVVAVGGG